MLVVDASVAVELSLDRVGGEATIRLGGEQLIGPPLLWSEVPSVISEMAYRREISERLATAALTRFANGDLGIAERRPDGLITEAWSLARAMGWAKTYDAEYLALARLLDCRLVTLDLRLRRGADRLGLVITPEEL